MATSEISSTCLSSENIDSLLFITKKHLENRNIESKNVFISKRNRDLRDSDYCIPKGCLEIGEEDIGAVCLHIKQESEVCPLQLRDVKSTKHYSLAYYLDRPSTFKRVLSRNWKQDFHTKTTNRKSIVLNPLGLHAIKRSADGEVDLEQLRSAVLLQHVGLLLQNAGYEVNYTSCSSQCSDILNLIGITADSLQTETTDSTERILTQEFIDKIKHNSYACNGGRKHCALSTSGDPCLENRSGAECSSSLGKQMTYKKTCDSKEENSPEKLQLDLKRYIQDKGIKLGKGCFDKNITVVDVMTESGASDVLSQVCHLQNTKEQVKDVTAVLHIVSASRSFFQQKVDLLWRVICPDTQVSQCHLVFGQVQARQSSSRDTRTAEQLMKLRQTQMRDAAVMKYGDEVKGPGWEATIMALTIAGIKFEILHPVHRNSVKLDLSVGCELGRGADNRSGAFVLYNCARLATLFSHFEQAVGKGLYPPLPKIEEINFSLLREEDEWFLLFHYVLPYEDLLKEILEDVIPCSQQISSKIHTHKICNFLTTLSRSLSSYYRRTHILTENRSHLLPVMYARLYFLKVIHKIMTHALSLMGISPLNQL